MINHRIVVLEKYMLDPSKRLILYLIDSAKRVGDAETLNFEWFSSLNRLISFLAFNQ